MSNNKKDIDIIIKSMQAIPDAYDRKDPMTNFYIDMFRTYWIQGYKKAKEDILKLIQQTDEQ